MKISKTERGQKALQSLERRLRVSNRSEQTIRNYVRCVKALMEYQQQRPDGLEIDQVIDFLNELQIEQERAWRTIKIYVTAFRWFYEHILHAKGFAGMIPYPKEKPSLPQILSREELASLFNSCTNKKHRAMFRLLVSGQKGQLQKTCTLPGETFIARFLLHVLPKGYCKIRHYGFFATRVKAKVLPPIREKLGIPNVPRPKYTVRDVLMITKGVDPLLCSACGSLLLTIAESPRPRGSPLQRLAC